MILLHHGCRIKKKIVFENLVIRLNADKYQYFLFEFESSSQIENWTKNRVLYRNSSNNTFIDTRKKIVLRFSCPDRN